MADLTKIEKISAFNQKQLAPENAKTVAGAQAQVAQNVATQNAAAGATPSPAAPAGGGGNPVTTSSAKGAQAANQPKPLTVAQQIALKAQQTRAVRQQQRDALEAARRAEEAQADALQKLGMQADTAQQRVGQITAPTLNWLSHLPTPGGIGTILLILGFFLLAVIPTDAQGNTRLKLLWLTLTGKTHLKDNSTAATSTTTTNTVGGTTRPATPGAHLTPTDSSGNCPVGYDRVTVSGGKVMCELTPPSGHAGPLPAVRTNGNQVTSMDGFDLMGVLGFGLE